MKKFVLVTLICATIFSTSLSTLAVTYNNIQGGTWSYGVGMSYIPWKLFNQYSHYKHPTRRHYANAMMNNQYSGRKYADAGKPAEARTKNYSNYGTHRSWYGFK